MPREKGDYELSQSPTMPRLGNRPVLKPLPNASPLGALSSSNSRPFSSQSMEEPQLSGQDSQGWIEDPRLAGRPPHEHDLMRKYSDAPMLFKAHAESFHVHEDEVDREERIGEGQVGTVCKGRFRGSAVAVKDLKSEFAMGSVAHSDILKELRVWSKLRHPNIATFIGACISTESPSLICEYMEGGSLEDVLSSKRRKLHRPWQPSRVLVHNWALHLCQALAYMHGFDPPLVHRDIKPANLLLSEDLRLLKVTDFGMARARPEGAYDMTGNTGTKRYMAPEVHCKQKDYGTGVDVYSSGMIMWMMCTGKRPWEMIPADKVADQAAGNMALRPRLSEVSWKEMGLLMQDAWAGDPLLRPSAEEMVRALETMKGRPRYNPDSERWCGLGSHGCMMSCW